MKIKVLLTGATSFSGAHIACSLVKRGFEVWGTLTQGFEDSKVDPRRLERMEFSRIKNWIPAAPLGSPNFDKALKDNRFQVWINHGAPITGYRKLDFDYTRSALDSLKGIETSLKLFSESDGNLIVHSGTIFEPNEGCETPGLEGASPALSPYGVSKNWVWQALRFWAQKQNISITKIVIPNPIGSLENPDRLIPVFAKTWKAQKELPKLRGGSLVRDNLPASWLGEVYSDEITLHLKAKSPQSWVRIRRPSGFVLKQKDFVDLAIKNLKERNPSLNFEYENDESNVDDIEERFNLETVEELLKPHCQKAFWDEYSNYLMRC